MYREDATLTALTVAITKMTYENLRIGPIVKSVG